MSDSSEARRRGILRGGFWGVAAQLVTLIIAFVTRNLFLRYLTLEMSGYNTLFADMTNVLSFAEAGLGTSISLALYKPLEDRDYARVSGIFRLLGSVYRVIGAAVSLLGLGMIALLPLLVKDGVENLGYMRVGLSLFVLNSVISYLFVPYKNFISVVQRGYVIEVLNMVGTVLAAVLKLAVLILTQNYLLFLVVQFGTVLALNVYCPWYMKRYFPYLQENKDYRLPREDRNAILRGSFRMVWFRLSSVVIGYTDNMITSAFQGIVVVGLFANYRQLIEAVGGFVRKLTGPISAAIGSFSAEKGPDQSAGMLGRVSFLCYLLLSFCCASLMALMDPFIVIWLGEKYLYNNIPALLFVVNMYISVMMVPLGDVFNISGCYQRHPKIAFVEVVSNLAVSLALVRVMGLSGVLLGTTACYVAGFLLRNRAVCREYFDRPALPAAVRQGGYLLLMLLLSGLTRLAAGAVHLTNPYLSFGAKLLICLLLPNLINILLFHRTENFRYLWGQVTHYVRAVRTRLLGK